MRPPTRPTAAVLALCAALALAPSAWANTAAETGSPAPLASVSDAVVTTHFYDLRKRVHRLPAQTPWVTALRGEEVLALGADTGLAESPLLGGAQTVYPLFRVDVASTTATTLGGIDLAPVVGPEARTRVLDFQYVAGLPARADGRARTLLSLATYSALTGCRSLVVTEVLVDLTGAGANTLGHRWFTLPCIRAFTPTEGTWLVGPGLHQSGGRVALLPRGQWRSAKVPEIALTIGDFAVLANLADQVPAKTRRLLSTIVRVPYRGAPSVVATGIRNAQGLTTATLDARPALVATTHGPRGGDGLLDVHQGDDYGWPRESYGTVYDYLPTPPQSRPQVEGKLPTATTPAFSWLPSIATSAVAQVARGGVFATWWGPVRGRPTGDLLVAGMTAGQLLRVRWDNGAVRYVEPITVGARVRSLTQTASGVLVAGIDTAGPDAGAVMVLDPVRSWQSR